MEGPWHLPTPDFYNAIFCRHLLCDDVGSSVIAGSAAENKNPCPFHPWLWAMLEDKW
jgi:hypothetical protein